MKTCVSSYSFGQYASASSLGILGIIEKAKEMGFDGIEFSLTKWGETPNIGTAIRNKAAEVGLEIPSLCVGADFITGSNGDLDAEIEKTCRLVDLAAEMGAARMRHDVTGGYPQARKISRGYSDALPRIAEACARITEYAKGLGVGTMTENHGFFSQDANRVEMLINTVADENFGALVDIGNFMCADEDPVKAVSIMAPYAVHVHAKDFHFKSGNVISPGNGWFKSRAGNYLRGAIIGHGDANAAQSIGVLKAAGYNGFVTVEFEGMEDNLVGIAQGLSNLKRFIEM